MNRILAGACLAFLSVAAHAAAPVDRIQSMLAKPDQLCGRFDQSKQLAGIKKPLASTGRFCVVAGKGILWRTLKPFPSTMRVTRNEIVNYQGDRVAMRLDAQQEPTVRMINGVLFSLLGGDLAQLDSLFDVEGAVDKQWKVTLKARSPALAKAIGTISLDGDAYVRNIHIHEASGDKTDIVFSDIRTGAGALTAEEAGQL
jgi:outer membrane lipoprotein-sorting protein